MVLMVLILFQLSPTLGVIKSLKELHQCHRQLGLLNLRLMIVFLNKFLIMKSMRFFFLMMLICFNSYCQETLHCIKFISGPSILKTPGTIQICVERLIIPAKDKYDSLDAVGIKTDMKTFRNLQSFIKMNKWVVTDPKKLRRYDTWLKIEVLNGISVYLSEHYFDRFFKELELFMQKKKFDPAVIKVLE